MASERDLELLDDYLTNRLNGEEKSAFQEKLNKDPELKNEFELQQQFIEGIKKVRITELKSMMNNVPVPGGQGGSVATGKVVGWAVVATLVGVGIYFYWNQSEVSKPNSSNPTAKQEKIDEKEAEKTQLEKQVPVHEDSPVVSAERASSEQKPSNLPKPIKKGQDVKNIKPGNPAAEVYDPTKEAEDNKAPEMVETPSAKLTHPTISVDIDSNNKDYHFNYQFKQGKLLLYGPFEKNLYEIMEFFNDDKRTLFLYYKDNYYLLRDDSEKLRPLTPIQDESLIRRLKEYKQN